MDQIIDDNSVCNKNWISDKYRNEWKVNILDKKSIEMIST